MLGTQNSKASASHSDIMSSSEKNSTEKNLKKKSGEASTPPSLEKFMTQSDKFTDT